MNTYTCATSLVRATMTQQRVESCVNTRSTASAYTCTYICVFICMYI